jgi:2-phosphosulfolactate phosphatase
MKINILQLLNGARQAKGLTVIIDVFRAFSVSCYAYGKGVERIYPVGDITEAYRLKGEHPEYVLIGERNEKKPPGFDYGNSPSQLLDADLYGKTMVHTTSSGTMGIANALQAGEIITGAFVNAGAIVRYVRERQPEVLSLVCMGYAGTYQTEEDTFLAEYVKARLEEKEVDFDGMVEKIRTSSGARFFSTEKQEWAPFTDFNLCMDLDRFNFVLKVEKESRRNYLRKIDI